MSIIFSASVLLASSFLALPEGDHRRTVTVDGLEREYLIHVPAKKPEGGKWPVVLIYHGGGANAKGMVRFCGLNEKADEAGFLAVYPNGTGRLELLTWNGGNCCGYAERFKIDDVKFAGMILDDLAKQLDIDEKKVFATGMSNGGIMAYRLASELADRIAAIAPVAGPMGTAGCSPSRGVPVCHFHGTLDEYAPFDGGVGAKSLSGTNFYSVDHSIRAWVKANGCDEKPEITKLPVRNEDGTSVTRTTYRGGRDGAEVVLYTITGGGHTWPGRETMFKVLGPTTKNVVANDVMWEFFQRHERK